MSTTIGSHGLFQLRDYAPRIPFFLVLFPGRERLSEVKKTTAVLTRAMTEKRERWQGKEWYGKAKPRWQQPAREDGGQSPHDTRGISQSKGKWREISAEMDAVGTAVKEKTNTWDKCCTESAKKRNRIVQKGRGCGHGRKARRKRKRNDQRPTCKASKKKGRRG